MWEGTSANSMRQCEGTSANSMRDDEMMKGGRAWGVVQGRMWLFFRTLPFLIWSQLIVVIEHGKHL